MADWNAIKDAVEKNGNVLTITMEQLREAPRGWKARRSRS